MNSFKVNNISNYKKDVIFKDLNSRRKLYLKLHEFIVSITLEIVQLFSRKNRVNAQSQAIDVLLIYSYSGESEKLLHFVKSLRNRNIVVKTLVLPKLSQILKKRWLKKPIYKIPFFSYLRVYSYYSTYIIDYFRPKVLITLADTLLYSPFLKNEIRGKGTYANISHSVTGSNRAFSMVDFDYMFIFGESSLKNLQKNNLLFGSSAIIKTGSPYFNYIETKLRRINLRNKILYLSQYEPSGVPDNKNAIQISKKLIYEFAKSNPNEEVLIKLHPLEGETSWDKYSLPNISVLNPKVNWESIVNKVNIAITCFSNASLEVSSYSVPVIMLCPYNIKDEYLYIEKYFNKRVISVPELEDRISEVRNNYDSYIDSCLRYVNFHIEHRNGIEKISELILKLVAGEQLKADYIINRTEII